VRGAVNGNDTGSRFAIADGDYEHLYDDDVFVIGRGSYVERHARLRWRRPDTERKLVYPAGRR
jgi:hypothetical protein